jgi:hypothetical protein
MRIVTGDAPKLTVTGAKTFAFVHLLELADKTVFRPLRRLHENRPEATKWQPGPIIFISLIDAQDPRTAGQMALRTDVISEPRRQIGRIYDRDVVAVNKCRTCDVKFARPVAAFAADRVTLENRRSILIDRTRLRVDTVCVAVQAIGLDWPVEMIVEGVETRR